MNKGNGEISICFNCMSPLNGDTICPRCGHDSQAEYNPDYKRPGSILVSRYLVGWLRHKNGEGALYKGYDRTERTTVWIREYFPQNIAERNTFTGTVSPKEGYEAQYKALMSDFVDMCNEVRRLSVSDAVVPIDDVFAEDNTVYAVFRDLHLISLESYLGKKGGKLPFDTAIDLLAPFYNTLSNMHGRGEIHRGISPYNVFVDPREGKLYLWGFALSATRTGGSELAAELYNGYSAPEQYASNGWQGAWTDVYAAAALLYRMVSGFVPPKSILISRERPLAPLYDLVMDISLEVSDAVADAMRLPTGERTQSISAFLANLLSENREESTSVYDTSKVVKAHREQESRSERRPRTKQARGGGAKYVAIALVCTVLALGGVIYTLVTTYLSDLIPDSTSSSSRGSSLNSPSQNERDDITGTERESEGADGEEEGNAMPSLVGMSAADVLTEYNGRYKFAQEAEYNDDYAEGVVYAHLPEEGAELTGQETITLYVSKGILKMKMPDLKDMTLDEVNAALKEMAEGYKYDTALTYTTHEQYVPTTEKDHVISTIPAAGEEFDPKRKQIVIYISNYESRETSQIETPESSSSRPSQSSSSSSSSYIPGQKDPNGIDM